MNRLPVQIATPHSAEDVTAEVKRLLRAAGVKDQLPTPKTSILACARLVETGELDLANYEATFGEQARHFFHRALSKVRGLLDRRTEVIYIDPSMSDPRRNFVSYHEIVHKLLPWQNVEITQDDDSTLSLDCEEIFEAEANFGSAEIVFQCERFEEEARDYEVSVESAIYLAQRYDASRHSAIRRFVERNHRPCLLLVAKPTSWENPCGGTSFFVAYSIPSGPFAAQFGDPLQLTYINPDHEIGGILNGSGSGQINLYDLKGFARTCNVESFTNTYRTFVLIWPDYLGRSRRVVRFSL